LLLVAACCLGGAFLAVSAPATEPRPLAGTVVGVAGGTLDVRLASGTRERVRILGVAVPGAGACFAEDARAEIGRLALGRRVSVVGDRARPARDRSGRLVAYVGLPGGVDLGRRLIDGGYAQVDLRGGFGRFLSYVPVQQLSERTNSGLWGACAADLAVTLDAPATAAAGQQVTYTATIANAGPLPARRPVLELRPPAGTALVAAASESGACTRRDWLGRCSLRSIAPEASVTATFVVEVREPGTVSTRALVRLAGCALAACGRVAVHDADLRDDESAALTVVQAAAPAPAPTPTPAPGPAQPPPPTPPPPGAACHPSYPDACIPPPPPDLDCADIPYRDFYVRRDIPDADPHILDGNEDGVGCQFDDY
jgi:uncharacterized repeat protein (TIGR01451 family)